MVGELSGTRRWARVARYFAWSTCAVAAIVLATALILPEVLDRPAVRAEIQRKLSEVVQGEVAWEDLRLRILPRPLGVLRKSRVKIPDKLDITADELAVRLAFWPLLRGRAEVVSVTLSRPAIRLDAAPPEAQDDGKGKDGEPQLDLVQAYRSTVGALADIVKRFAPDTVLSIEDARLEFSAPGILPIALHDVSVSARTGHTGMDVDAGMAGTHWTRLKIAAHLKFADLSGKADIEVAGFKPQPWLDHYLGRSPVHVAIPSGDLRLRAVTDGKTALESEFDVRAGSVGLQRAGERVEIAEAGVKGRVTAGVGEIVVHLGGARLGSSRLGGGSLRYRPRDGSITGDIGYDLDLAQGMNATRRLVPASAGAVLSWFQPVTGRAQGSVKLALGGPGWNVTVHIAKTDASVQVRDLPGPAQLAHGTVEIDRHGVKVSDAAASLPAGHVRLAALRHTYRNQATVARAGFDLDLAQGMDLARRASGNDLAVIQSASGRARGTTKLAFGPKDWSVGVEIEQANAQVQVRGLPGPAGLARGSVHLTSAAIKVERAAVTLLDAKATGSAVVNYRDEVRVQGSISEGAVGARFLEWVWQIGELPPHVALDTPVGVTAPRFVWGPKGAVDVNATALFVGGQSVTADFGWVSGALNLRRATIRDRRSDAVLGARVAGSRVEGEFSGTLHGSSIAAVVKSAIPREGGVSGKFRLAFDRDRPRDASAEGNLKGESLDISWLTGRAVNIERIDLAATAASLRIREAAVNWAGQRATIRGDIKRGVDGLVVDAQLDSPGVDLDALFPAGDSAMEPPADVSGDLRIWPLPVTGQLVVRSGYLQRGRYRVEPVAATLELQPQRALLELQQARLCGISVPLVLEATPAGFAAAATITAQKQQVADTARCLADQHLLITGEFDLKANLTWEGKLEELARSTKGSVVADIRDGNVMKFALLGNILSMQNVSSLMKEGGPSRLEAKGFPYRTLKIAGQFDKGRFVVEEGAFHSDAVGLAATGWISLTEPQSRLTVLVAPFSRVDQLVRKVPILGYVVGGVFTSVPVGVSGDIRDPLVVPLGPAAITSEVLGIFERTLNLPVKLVTPVEK